MNNSHQMKMAKNIANLRAKSSKKQQAHLLCQSIVKSLKRGKE